MTTFQVDIIGEGSPEEHHEMLRSAVSVGLPLWLDSAIREVDPDPAADELLSLGFRKIPKELPYREARWLALKAMQETRKVDELVAEAADTIEAEAYRLAGMAFLASTDGQQPATDEQGPSDSHHTPEPAGDVTAASKPPREE